MKSLNMDKFRNKLKNEEENKNKKGGNDKRFLNYFDLEFNQTMTIRLMPDGGDTEELWLEYATHGPNLKNQLVDSITCANMNDEKCPACSYSYSHYLNGEKDEAGKWRAKNTFIAQCIVIDSPIEVNQSEDGNMVKLMYLPYGMKEVIKESIINGTVLDPTELDFVIKKSKNAGGWPQYDKSFFRTQESDIPTEVLESIGDGTSYLYSLTEELPKVSTAVEVDAWLTKARSIVEGGAVDNDDSTTSDPVAPVSSKSEQAVEEKAEGKVNPKALMDKLKNKNRNNNTE